MGTTGAQLLSWPLFYAIILCIASSLRCISFLFSHTKKTLSRTRFNDHSIPWKIFYIILTFILFYVSIKMEGSKNYLVDLRMIFELLLQTESQRWWWWDNLNVRINIIKRFERPESYPPGWCTTNRWVSLIFNQTPRVSSY